MTRDARFEDAAEAPLALRAQTPEDVTVLAALVQDAVLSVTEIRYDRRGRRLALLLNRFRWEDRAEEEGRPYERVRALLVVSDVTGVASLGLDRRDADTVLSILDLAWEPGSDGTGRVVITLAGDGAIAASVECLGIDLRDVTRPYRAVSGKRPVHPG
ncbi:hypothetical protein CCR83_14545 [Rhodobacter veldkampii DSM 11550]|uniref:DUF2948 domain-containing protein n=1 Tax=Phaeovulum veldkampii DSM 11550 TaxID=1185920 RepID=A0A2T4JIU3_9RHOB|nr:DUF2948 family protein [Phaeovulum veldkampii]MBK5947635.1 hypothetical protein [Phaeovulum veldkampii DSM 11550]NCU20342.1 DUF2948 family protein [Candidatus Falkowbacteria bacterium]PTE17792.1 DUF2948 domain-containing protein [Phaeovulum veldkampii DSM 11550]TDQ63335.1 DUF2948 family protein [Phaeovulum veldkampii DSM 11550]